MNEQIIKAWHFSNGYLTHDLVGQEVYAGLELECEPGEIKMCDDNGDGYGFYGSRDILDALRYGGSVLSLCEYSGRIIDGGDKLVASKRRHVIVCDISHTLHRFAIDEARLALSNVDNPDPRSLKALTVKERWLAGEATDEDLTAASNAAWGVDWDARAIWDASNDAWGATWDARDASNAAWGATWGAAWTATRQRQSDTLTAMILALPEFAGVGMRG